MLVPTTGRVLIKRITNHQDTKSGLVLAGQLIAGENLNVGEVIHPGDTDLEEGQVVYYSEYSAAACIDYGKVLSGGASIGEAMKPSNMLFIVAADDVMAIEDDVDILANVNADDTKKV